MAATPGKWQVLHSETMIENRWLTVRCDRCRTSAGRIVPDYYVIHKPDYAIMVAITAQRHVILVRQYKHPAGELVLELPAGYIQSGEAPEDCAYRELLEETGYHAKRIRHLGTLKTSPAVLTNHAHVFLCEELHNTQQQHLDPNEEIEILSVPLADILAPHKNTPTPNDVSSMAALLLTQMHFQREATG